MSEVFQFRRFSICQDACAMKVGTDGVLLGAWTALPTLAQGESALRVLDVGTGTGVIALMLAQRLDEDRLPFHIDAVEIDPDAANQAKANFDASPWAGRLHVYPCSLAQMETMPIAADDADERRYDLIVSNPPFFNATLKPDDAQRAIARHKDSLPVSDIARFARQYLSATGRLSLIYPADYDAEVQCACIASGLRLMHQTRILTKEGKPCKRIMAEYVPLNSPCATVLCADVLPIRDLRGEYTDQYRQLTLPFYLFLH